MTDCTIYQDKPRAGHPIHGLALNLSLRIARILRRRKFKTLLDLDDHILDDIGVLRHEVAEASRLPLSVDAATTLHRISLERRKSRM